MVKFSTTTIFLFLILFSNAQNIFDGYDHLFSKVRNYVVYQVSSEMIIDGKPDEISWDKADWSEYFQDIEGEERPIPKYNTRFKMLWDDQNLYILAELEEPHIWAYYTKRDQIVYHENDFEIFIDPDRNTHNYFEFELNAQNTLMDLFMPKPYRNGGKFNIGWDAEGFKSTVSVDGTLNDPSDIDNKWTVEMAIPFSSLKLTGDYIVPDDGNYWKINFSRVQWHTEIIDGKYVKLKDPKTKRYLSEENWVWSEQGVINMHLPERWGIATFSTNLGGGNKIDFVFSEEENLGRYLWLLYYKQQTYKRENSKFAVLLSDIGLKEKLETEKGEIVILEMKTSETGFKAFLDNKNGLELSIDQDGLFQKTSKK